MRLSKEIIGIITLLSMALAILLHPSHLSHFKTAAQDNLLMFPETEIFQEAESLQGTENIDLGDRSNLAQTTVPAPAAPTVTAPVPAPITAPTPAASPAPVAPVPPVPPVVFPVSTAGNFSDDFSGTALKPQWKWLNESAKDWSLTDGRLKLRRYQGHGFYKTPETYSGQSPVPILYLDDVALSEGFVVQTQAGFFNTNPFGQVGIMVFKDLDNYFKFVIEFNISQQIIVVLLKETNGVDSRTPVDLIDFPWQKTSVEMRLTYKGGRLITEIREPGTDKWIPHFDTSCNLPIGKVKVGLFAESDQPEQGSQEYAWIDNFHLSSTGNLSTTSSATSSSKRR
jgi:regulation of enolase protein 1 (concanavalin A-like superfamily)